MSYLNVCNFLLQMTAEKQLMNEEEIKCHRNIPLNRKRENE